LSEEVVMDKWDHAPDAMMEIGQKAMHVVVGVMGMSLWVAPFCDAAAVEEVAAAEHALTLSRLTDAGMVLLVVVLAGGFGGFVDGLLHDRTYQFRLMHMRINLGSIGDALVGIAAGIAIFTVASALFGIEYPEIWKPDHFLKMVAIGVIAGFAGIRLLNPMSERMVERIASEQVARELEQRDELTTEMSMDLAKAEGLLDRFDNEKLALRSMPAGEGEQSGLEVGAELLQQALKTFDLALQRDAMDQRALRGKSRTYRRLAEWIGDSERQREYWQKAMGILSGIIKRQPGAAWARYNRACYRVLSDPESREWRKDLAEAFAIREDLGSVALIDPDLRQVKGEVQRLIEKGNGGAPHS
jgi:hypothetical protein